MKKTVAAAALLVPAMMALQGCEDFISGGKPADKGYISWSFDAVPPCTKADTEAFPDTNTFHLTVTGQGGKVLYDGSYGDSPEVLSVEEGSYTVSVVSADFTMPAFSSPQYGDTKVAVVRSGQNTRVMLQCSMLNCGIRIIPDAAFTTVYPKGRLFVGNADGRLPYAADEKRTAYFRPGSVYLVLDNDSVEETLFTRNIPAREILTVSLSVPGGYGAGNAQGRDLSIAVDTSAVYENETFVIGDGVAGGIGSSKDKALSITQAKASTGAKGVWVYGYIVGGDLTSAGAQVHTGPEFTKDTHLAIAARTSTTEKASCIAVELKKGAVRDGLNLVSHPDLLHKTVFLKGDLVEAYFGTVGLKNVSDYALK